MARSSRPAKLSILSALFLILGACAPGGARAPAVMEIRPAEVLKSADGALLHGDLKEAARLYSWLLEAFPRGSESGGAQFGLARVQMLRGELAQAAADFAQFRLNFPYHPLSGRALLYMSECNERLAQAKKPPKKHKAPPPPAARKVKPPEPLVAAQILLWDAPTWEALDGEMARLAAAGFNAVLFRAFSNPEDRVFPFVGEVKERTGFYFQTSHAPVVADILARVAGLAHRHKLAFYAWMTSRYADYGLPPPVREAWGERTYDLAAGATVPGKGLDVFNGGVVRHLENIFSDLARYPIDGVLFQDDLVSRHTDGYSQAAAAEYQGNFRKPLDPSRFYHDVVVPDDGGKPRVRQYTDDFWAWAEWKNRRILDVAARLGAKVRGAHPKAKVAVNFMYEAASAPRNGLAWLSQSLSEAHRRDFDYYAIMAYHRQMQEELGLSLEEVCTLLRRMSLSLYAGARPERAVIKLQIRDWRDASPIPLEEMSQVTAAVMEGARGTGVVPNLAVVPYRNAADLERLPSALLHPAGAARAFPGTSRRLGYGSVQNLPK